MPNTTPKWITSTPGSAISDNGFDIWLVDTTAASVTLTFDAANFPANWGFAVKHARTSLVPKICTIALTGGAEFNGSVNSFTLLVGSAVRIVKGLNAAETAYEWETL